MNSTDLMSVRLDVRGHSADQIKALMEDSMEFFAADNVVFVSDEPEEVLSIVLDRYTMRGRRPFRATQMSLLRTVYRGPEKAIVRPELAIANIVVALDTDIRDRDRKMFAEMMSKRTACGTDLFALKKFILIRED